MTNERDDDLDALRRANPANADQLRRSIRESDRDQIRRTSIGSASASSRPQSRLAYLLVAGAGVAVVALVAGLFASDGGDGGSRAYAADARRAADQGPRVLTNLDGWEVADVSFDTDGGSLEFKHESDSFQVDWATYPAEWFEGASTGYRAQRLDELDQWYRSGLDTCPPTGGPEPCGTFVRDQSIEVLGQAGILEEVRDLRGDEVTASFTVYLDLSEDSMLSIYPSRDDEQLIREFVDSLYETDADSWLAAMPPETVDPLERPEVVDQMLADVPVPQSVDIEALKGEISGGDRYSVGAQVTGAVACGWLDQWRAAISGNDDASAAEAVEAMSTARGWDILDEMTAQGEWSQTIWEYAGEMRRDERQALLGTSGTEVLPDGRAFTLGPSYASGLGCDSQERTLIPEEDLPNYARPAELTPVDRPG